MFNAKVVGLVGLLSVAMVGCASGEDAVGGGGDEAELGTAQSAIWTDLSLSNLQYRVEIKNQSTGYCMDVTGGVAAAGTRVNEASCNHGLSQQFHIVMVTFTAYQIVWKGSASPQLCVGFATSAPNYAATVLVPCRDAQSVAPMGTRFSLDNSNDLQNPTTSHLAFRATNVSGGGACLDGKAPPLFLQQPPPVLEPQPVGPIGLFPKKGSLLTPPSPPPPLQAYGCNAASATQMWVVTNW